VKAPTLDVERTALDAPPRRRHWRRFALALAGVALVLIGVVAARYLFRANPGAKEVNDALRQFHAAPSVTITRDARYPAPAAGVYELAGRGSEHISFPPSTQQDSAVMPATVTYIAENCWRWHLDYNVAHWEEYDFCPRGGQLLQAANRNFQSWDLGVAKIKNLAQFACDPPKVVLTREPQLGDEVRNTCTGTNTALAGETTTTGLTRVVGTETLSVDGSPVSAVHQREESTVAGAQEGSTTQDWWYSVSSGLPLRMERNAVIRTRSPLGGTITYTESGSWQMQHTVPRT